MRAAEVRRSMIGAVCRGLSRTSQAPGDARDPVADALITGRNTAAWARPTHEHGIHQLGAVPPLGPHLRSRCEHTPVHDPSRPPTHVASPALATTRRHTQPPNVSDDPGSAPNDSLSDLTGATLPSEPHFRHWKWTTAGGAPDGAPSIPLPGCDDVDAADDAGGRVPVLDVLGRAFGPARSDDGLFDGVLHRGGHAAGPVPGRRAGRPGWREGRRAWVCGERGAPVADARDAAGPGHRPTVGPDPQDRAA